MQPEVVIPRRTRAARLELNFEIEVFVGTGKGSLTCCQPSITVPAGVKENVPRLVFCLFFNVSWKPKPSASFGVNTLELVYRYPGTDQVALTGVQLKQLLFKRCGRCDFKTVPAGMCDSLVYHGLIMG